MKKKLFRYKNIDIIKTLEIIAAGNTHYYLSDFESDKKILLENINKKHPETMLWMSRDCGTWCFPEKNVFMKNSVAYLTWTYYKNFHEKILAYAIDSIGIEGGVLIGNLYELDYHTYVQTVEQSAVRANKHKFIFENGESIYPDSEFSKWRYGHPQLGAYQASFPIPNNAMELKHVLTQEKEKRDKMKEGNISKKTDTILEKIWAELGDVLVHPETEKLESGFSVFEKGADKYEDVWRWFDERYSGGVAALLGLG